MTLLNDDEWSQWSNREIARQCAVAHGFVNKLRGSLDTESSEDSERTYTTKHGTTSTMNTENIGKAAQTIINVHETSRELRNLHGLIK